MIIVWEYSEGFHRVYFQQYMMYNTYIYHNIIVQCRSSVCYRHAIDRRGEHIL